MGFLVLVRHGESRWNLANKFTGWVDVPLSEKGVYEALLCAENLQGLQFDVCFTSTLIRAQQTLFTVLAKQDNTGILLHTDEQHKKRGLRPGSMAEDEIPIYIDSALNERFYGDLQGMNKDTARDRWGEEQVHLWRRSWDVAPPGGESLKDTAVRTLPYFMDVIMKRVEQGENVLVSAHGNSLRAIIKRLDGISDEDIPNLELPTGKPIIYDYRDGTLVRDEQHTFSRPLSWQS